MRKKIFKLAIILFLMTSFSNMNISSAKAEETTDQTTGGITDVTTDGSTDGTTNGTTDGATNGTTDGVTNGTTDGMTNGTTDGMTNGTTDGTTSGTTDGTTEVPIVVLPMVNSITITQQPSKTNYTKGEELDLTGLVVQGNYPDGSSGIVTGYEIVGYNKDQIGPQTVILYYQNQVAIFNVFIQPTKVTNITASYHDTTTLTLTWDAINNAARYEIYVLDDTTGSYNLLTYVYTNSFSMNYLPGSIHTYRICTVENVMGVEYKGEMSDVFATATNPEAVTDLMVSAIGTNSISLSWNPVNGATGYLVYKSVGATGEYVVCKSTTSTFFTNTKLTSGKSYQYKVCAYTLDRKYSGEFSNFVDLSTNPSAMVMKIKAGDQKARISWKKVNGATTYDIYIGDSENGFVLLTTLPGDSSPCSYMVEGLTTGSTYSFYAVARRDYNGISYLSPDSDLLNVEVKPIDPTSSSGKYFKTEEAFYNSYAYKQLSFFKTYVDYSRSYAIPGLISTNAGGFNSTTMCPQGITFAKNYLLVSAYDMTMEENTVIYVYDKVTKELMTTLVLPSKPHAGGLAFDGFSLWVTNGSKVSSVLYTDIDAAAQSRAPYVNVNYQSVCQLSVITSYVTYYNKKLWVGTYNELESTVLYSFTINDKYTTPSLTVSDSIVMPTRVQGIAFTKKGTLIMSRSCQLFKGLRGYMRQLDVYKPDYANAVNGVITLGNLVNSVNMPSMNEGIAIDGYYVYVNFESAAFADASYKMDRICAFKLTDVATKTAAN